MYHMTSGAADEGPGVVAHRRSPSARKEGERAAPEMTWTPTAVLYLLGDGLSEKAVAFGGLGGFGFEYHFMTETRDGPVSYHMELGGIGTNARADKLAGKPLFGGGFVINVGMRWYL
jgi:hypothetical protein